MTGCGSSAALRVAAIDTGKIAAGITMPPLPDDCRKKEPYGERKVGDEARTVIRRGDRALDRANARVQRCAENYDNVAETMEGRQP